MLARRDMLVAMLSQLGVIIMLIAVGRNPGTTGFWVVLVMALLFEVLVGVQVGLWLATRRSRLAAALQR